MKKVLFVAISAILLAASCQKTEIINPVSDQQGMVFTTQFGKLTKAADAENEGIVNLKQQNFRVWGYAAHDFDNTPKNDVTEDGGIYDKMFDIKVEFKNEAWDPGKQYFWPGANKNLYFFAVSDTDDFLGVHGPEAADATTDSPVTINMTNAADAEGVTVATPTSMLINDYEVTPASYNNDLMVADFVRQSQEDNEKKVSLNFRHALSKVQFLFVTNPVEDISVFVQKLEVVGLTTKGDLTVTPAEFATNEAGVDVAPVSLAWTLSTVATDVDTFVDDYVLPYEGTDFPAKIDGTDPTAEDKQAMKIVATGAENSPAQQFATWLVLPQNIEGKKVKITYLINERQFSNEFALDKGLTAWTVNQYVKYTINLSPNLISFDAKVEDWTTDPENGVNHQN